MTTFSIDAENNIVAYLDAPVKTSGLQIFSSEKQLAKLSAHWPNARFLDIWNSFAGTVPFSDLRPVRKFTDRASAGSRIWKAIQRLTPVTSTALDAKDQTETLDAPSPDAKRRESKTALVLEMLHRSNGATLNEIMEATSWQPHTVRGYISGTVGKKLGLTVISSRSDSGQRCYRVSK